MPHKGGFAERQLLLPKCMTR